MQSKHPFFFDSLSRLTRNLDIIFVVTEIIVGTCCKSLQLRIFYKEKAISYSDPLYFYRKPILMECIRGRVADTSTGRHIEVYRLSTFEGSLLAPWTSRHHDGKLWQLNNYRVDVITALGGVESTTICLLHPGKPIAGS